MLRFRVGGIPVDVHLSHLLISALLSFQLAQVAGPEGWPGAIINNLGSPERAHTLGLVALLWMAIITSSALVHELGHALVSRAFGYQPSVHLLGMGGLTQPNANETIPWHKDLLLTAAGPAFGAGLGLLALLALAAMPGASAPLRYGVGSLAAANLFWAAVNLVPVAPLDGGKLSVLLLMRALGRKGFLVAQVVALAVSAVAVALGAAQGAVLLAVFFGFYAARAVSAIRGYQRGELPEPDAAHPNEVALAEAEKQLHAGALDAARSQAEAVLQLELQPPQRARAHHLLGWVALKEGAGRRALDHFSQAQGVQVAPHALAAAFSLLGDEARALPLWEAAARSSDDLTIRHEFAGALLRAGREADARRLPGVRLALAYTAAERVHHLRKEYDKAAAFAEAAFHAEPGPEFAYDAGCAWALAGDLAAAMRMLGLAAQNGFARRELARADPDLASLRGLPEFEEWLAKVGP